MRVTCCSAVRPRRAGYEAGVASVSPSVKGDNANGSPLSVLQGQYKSSQLYCAAGQPSQSVWPGPF